MSDKKKFYLNQAQRKGLIVQVFNYFGSEAWLAQKASEVKKIKCDKCDHIMERKLDDIFNDYRSGNAWQALCSNISLFEPEFFKEKMEGKDLSRELVGEISTFLGGVSFDSVEADIPAVNPNSAPSGVKDAIQIKDLQEKKIIPARTIPMNPKNKK